MRCQLRRAEKEEFRLKTVWSLGVFTSQEATQWAAQGGSDYYVIEKREEKKDSFQRWKVIEYLLHHTSKANIVHLIQIFVS